eukprot:4135573-Prymnesium_polylepis.1
MHGCRVQRRGPVHLRPVSCAEIQTREFCKESVCKCVCRMEGAHDLQPISGQNGQCCAHSLVIRRVASNAPHVLLAPGKPRPITFTARHDAIAPRRKDDPFRACLDE